MQFLTETISDLDIQALVDGQMAPAEAKSLREALAREPRLLARYRALVAQKRLLKACWSEIREADTRDIEAYGPLMIA